MDDISKIKIAGDLTIQDWDNLIDTLDISQNENWCIAFNFFEQRITTRYLNPINQILSMDLNTGEGFAVVNLQCSLIETIESFHEGWIFNNMKYYYRTITTNYLKYPLNSNNKMSGNHIFESFFKNREPFKSSNPAIPDSFYSDVRCGLLHETQTKNNWVIKENKTIKDFYLEDNNTREKIIYRSNFQRAILEVKENYKKIIVDGIDNTSQKKRENFKAKFNRICEVSKTI